MTALTQDTWGIPGPIFIVYYVLVSVVALALLRMAWRATRPGPHAAKLSPLEMAVLTAGGERVIAARLTEMYLDGRIKVSKDGLQVASTKDSGRQSLDQALLRSVRANSRDNASTLTGDSEIVAAVREIRHRLVAKKLIPSWRQLALWLGIVILLWTISVVGIVRLIAGLSAGKPVGYLLAVVLVMSVATAVTTLRRPGAATRKDLRTKYRDLHPTVRPAWETYGATKTAKAVAVYGPGVVWSVAPQLAQALGLDNVVTRPPKSRSRTRRRSRWFTGGGGTFVSSGGSSGGGGGGCGG